MRNVKQVAQQLGMSEHTIRYYTDLGLVPSVQRDRNNNRLFDDESLNWLTGVRHLRESGMSLDSIRMYCDLCLEGDATIEQRYRIILEQKALAERQLEEAKKCVAYLTKKADTYVEIIHKRKPDTMNPATWPTNQAGTA